MLLRWSGLVGDVSDIGSQLKRLAITGPPVILAVMLSTTLIDAQVCNTDSPASLSANSHNPLHDVLKQLSNLTGVPINFEEAPYEHPNDVLTSGEVDTLHGVRPPGPGAPRGGQFVAILDPKDRDVYSRTQAILDSYVNSKLPGSYELLPRNGNSVTIVATQVLGVDGKIKKVLSPLDAGISFPVASRLVIETMQLIAEEASKNSGALVTIFTYSVNDQYSVTMGADGQSAREVLADLSSKTSGRLSYTMTYDPYDKTYALNFDSSAYCNPPLPAPTAAAQTTQPKVAPANSPFFVKAK